MPETRDGKSLHFALSWQRLAAQHGLVIASAGTHPFSHWMDQLITVNERYATLVNDMQQVARVCLTFGLHVHVGIPDREEAIDIMNQARYFLPHLYALSVNSPFWLGQNTGLKAYRQMIFERLPRTGIPDAFQSLSEYEDYWKLLVPPSASIIRRRFGGTSGCTRFSTRLSFGFAMRNRA
jgi:Uncharacterized conserved protein